LNETQYKEIESKVAPLLSGLEGELKGSYYPLLGMSKNTRQQLSDDRFLFMKKNRFLQAANAYRFWPIGRGIYHNDEKNFLVWVNEEDHLSIMSMQPGGDLATIYKRMVAGVSEIEKQLPLSHKNPLGFLSGRPTNLGTTIRASVHIKLPKLASNKALLDATAGQYNLQVRKKIMIH
jgi:arginine kinase